MKGRDETSQLLFAYSDLTISDLKRLVQELCSAERTIIDPLYQVVVS